MRNLTEVENARIMYVVENPAKGCSFYAKKWGMSKQGAYNFCVTHSLPFEKNKTVKLFSEEDEEFIRKNLGKMSTKKLQEKIGCSTFTLNKYIEKNMASKKNSDILFESKIEKIKNSELKTIKEWAQIFNLSYSGMSNFLKQNNLPYLKNKIFKNTIDKI